ncbi:hypothetical protein H1R20_g1031, partial [Candolleomyces eurysporus]
MGIRDPDDSSSTAIFSILAVCPEPIIALASTVVRFLTVQAKQGYDALGPQLGTRDPRGKDETTIAGFEEHLSRQEAELLLAATRNQTVDALSENLSKAKATVAERDATIIQLKEQAVVLASMMGAQLPPTTTQNCASTEENEGTHRDHSMQKAMEIERLEGQKMALESMVAELHPTLESNRVLTEENQKYRTFENERVAQHRATITSLEQQKTELESEAAELTDRNGVSTEETKKYEIDPFPKQKFVDTLSKELSKARETVAQDHVTIISLKQQKTELESKVAELTDRNRVLTEETKKCGIDLLFKQKFVDALFKELSNATEKGVQDHATIIGLKQWKTELESEAAELTDKNRVLTEKTKKYETDLLLHQKLGDALSKELSNAAEKGVQDRAAFIGLKRWNTELELEVAELTEGNRVLGEEHQKHESRLISMEEDVNALSEDLSKARGLVAQHKATITSLTQRNMVLESVVSEAKLLATNDGNRDLTEGSNEQYRISLVSMQRDVETLTMNLSMHDAAITKLEKQEEELKFALDLKNLEIDDLKQKLTRSEAELEEKIEEVADWRDFCKLPGRPESVHLIRIRRDASASEKPSLRSILAGKDHEIEKLVDKLSQCHSQLALCGCNRVSPLLLPKQAEQELPASNAREVQTTIF